MWRLLSEMEKVENVVPNEEKKEFVQSELTDNKGELA